MPRGHGVSADTLSVSGYCLKRATKYRPIDATKKSAYRPMDQRTSSSALAGAKQKLPSTTPLSLKREGSSNRCKEGISMVYYYGGDN